MQFGLHLLFFGAGNRTWTCMSVTSHGPEPCASANSAIPAMVEKNWWMGMDSNHRSLRQRIYSPLPLATREPIHVTCVELTIHFSRKQWSWWWDSNPQPADYKSAALPIELHQPASLVPQSGLEPPTQGFSVPCSTSWATEAKNGDPEGARTPDLQRDRLAY